MDLEIEELNTYIEERFQNNYNLLVNDFSYSNVTKLFNYKHKNFIKELSKEDIALLEDLLEMKNALASKEVHLAYRIGLNDGIKLSSDIN